MRREAREDRVQRKEDGQGIGQRTEAKRQRTEVRRGLPHAHTWSAIERCSLVVKAPACSAATFATTRGDEGPTLTEAACV